MPGNSSATLLFQHSSRKVARRPLRDFFSSASAQILGAGEDARLITATCLITNDARLRALNREFLAKDYATDVLSFRGAQGGGEIAISLDTAQRQAAELGHGLEQELRILMLHGLLHLAGMDHETDSGEMARAEARWRRRLGLVPGLIERAHKKLAPQRKAVAAGSVQGDEATASCGAANRKRMK